MVDMRVRFMKRDGARQYYGRGKKHPRPPGCRATVKEVVMKRIWEAGSKWNEKACETIRIAHYLGAVLGAITAIKTCLVHIICDIKHAGILKKNTHTFRS